ncbi:aminotransferase class IV [Dactylosporangium salmoneum]|uniref:aminotransferase class IV n=1 Tax=Dactylosporangium salmoneum TaxID=53361 RepID=UPI0031DBB563
MSSAPIRLEIDGREPEVQQLYGPLLSGDGHFTAMQVRGGRVRGLDLHLSRLSATARELFAADLDPSLVRARIVHAIRGVPDCAVRVYVYQPDDLMIMVMVRPPSVPPAGPLALRSVRYERPAAHLKHVGGFGQVYHRRRAAAEGFDDALLTDHTGAVEETAIANIGFFDGAAVTWPAAPHLPGIAMLLLAPLLPSRRAPVLLGDLPSFRSAFVCNSIGITPVGRVDDVSYPPDPDLMSMLAAAEAGIPWDAI